MCDGIVSSASTLEAEPLCTYNLGEGAARIDRTIRKLAFQRFQSPRPVALLTTRSPKLITNVNRQHQGFKPNSLFSPFVCQTPPGGELENAIPHGIQAVAHRVRQARMQQGLSATRRDAPVRVLVEAGPRLTSPWYSAHASARGLPVDVLLLTVLHADALHASASRFRRGSAIVDEEDAEEEDERLDKWAVRGGHEAAPFGDLDTTPFTSAGTGISTGTRDPSDGRPRRQHDSNSDSMSVAHAM